jgi:hypothetical protein
MLKYNFKVKTIDKIDNYRISKENPKAEFLLVGRKGDNNIPQKHLLMIHNSFASKFTKEDNQVVLRSPLYCDWGWACQYHRAWHVYSSEIPQIIESLRKAKQYLDNKKPEQENNIIVKVTELDISEKRLNPKTPSRGTSHRNSGGTDLPIRKKPMRISWDGDIYNIDAGDVLQLTSKIDDIVVVRVDLKRLEEDILEVTAERPSTNKNKEATRCTSLSFPYAIGSAYVDYVDKNLLVNFHGTSKLHPDKVVVDGEVYVKELPF